MSTIEQYASYSYTTTTDAQYDHITAYRDCARGNSPEYDHENYDGTHQWTIEGVTQPDSLEYLFDTDSAVLAYYQVTPLCYAEQP